MPGLVYSSDSDDIYEAKHSRLFGRERPIHQVLGGGKVADVLLWRNRNVSAALLGVMTVIWFLFEVVEYNFVTLLCHASITTMLVIFIWRMVTEIFKLTPPRIPKVILDESTFRNVASMVHKKLNRFLSKLIDSACGKDLPFFILAIFSLYILSVIGTYFSFLNLLYLGFLCLETLPVLYEKFEEDVDHLAGKVTRELKRSYRKFEAQFLNKIPRGPVKDRKIR
ncbi:PREDICTED: reticulon-like protein B9 [Fragaria vesca subsp. vesca]|uniref:reticulon-like protein B9 n=1 Tax=Fragaria vesca subsp. vesca TaxID=101020 RepID=UPI0002C35850|nr:PREDICTED: reticulon-like protein B9 [Fragaria vesca subsp. vesca]